MSLPDEILIDIFEYLPIRELGFMAMVCKQVRPFSDDPFLWRSIVYKCFPFCNGEDFGNNWKNCFKVHSKLKLDGKEEDQKTLK